MAPRSTAQFISYDLRPAKQCERRVMLDVIRIAGDSGLPVRSYRYVGMGGNRFYDFLLMHKHIGIADMVSLEHDPNMYPRASFNRPYGFIKVLPQSTSEFLSDDEFVKPTILWLDYDDAISAEILEDIATAATKLKIGDFCFVTVPAYLPAAIEDEATAKRVTWLNEELGKLAHNVEKHDVGKKQFAIAVLKILNNAFQFAFSSRTGGRFVKLLRVMYSDTSSMLTVGGGFFSEDIALEIERRMAAELPFLSADSDGYYLIRTLHVTELERALFDLAATNKRGRSHEANRLRSLGFKDDDIKSYRELIRFWPRYVETMV